jgi:hypothetical protein
LWHTVRPIKFPLLVGFWSAILTLGFGIFARMVIDDHLPPPGHWLDVWMRWDVLHYLELARHGYSAGGGPSQRFLIVFLPLYPFTIKLLKPFVGELHLAALLVSNLACVGAFVFAFLLVQKERGTRIARRAVCYFAIFPTAYFLHIAYTESLFLFLTIAAFYYARCGRWPLCAVFAMLATGTRVFGVAVLPALAFEYLQQRNFRWREIRWDLAWMFLAPVGLLFYLWINYRISGDPLHFLPIQREHWFHYLRSPFPALKSSWDGVTAGQAVDRVCRHGPQLLAFAAGTLAVVFSAFRLRWTYTVYLAVTWVIIFCDNFPLSSPRYLLSQFPLFSLLASWARRPWRQFLLTFSFLLLYALYATQFARGWWGAG